MSTISDWRWAILYALCFGTSLYVAWTAIFGLRLPYTRFNSALLWSGLTVGFLGLALSRWLVGVGGFDFRWLARLGFVVYVVAVVIRIVKQWLCQWRAQHGKHCE
jgi:hypothetical protein